MWRALASYINMHYWTRPKAEFNNDLFLTRRSRVKNNVLLGSFETNNDIIRRHKPGLKFAFVYILVFKTQVCWHPGGLPRTVYCVRTNTVTWYLRRALPNGNGSIVGRNVPKLRYVPVSETYHFFIFAVPHFSRFFRFELFVILMSFHARFQPMKAY